MARVNTVLCGGGSGGGSGGTPRLREPVHGGLEEKGKHCYGRRRSEGPRAGKLISIIYFIIRIQYYIYIYVYFFFFVDLIMVTITTAARLYDALAHAHNRK